MANHSPKVLEHLGPRKTNTNHFKTVLIVRCRSPQLRPHQVLRYNGVSGQTVVKCSNTFVTDFAQRQQNSGGIYRRVHSYIYTEQFDDY